mmetsp:Transcript_7363/g.6132  ORF Transcript_7363/g.6132 Transcript_7363/m.6132 type:complete len:166 (+) Transcript_7363:46-543(+)
MTTFTQDILTKTKESATTTTTASPNIVSNSITPPVVSGDTSDASLITLSICSVVTIAAVGLILWLNPLKDPNHGYQRHHEEEGHPLTRSTSASSSLSSNDKYDYQSYKYGNNKDSRWYRLPRLVSTLSVIKEEDDNDKNNEYYPDDFEDTSTMSSELEYDNNNNM